MSRPSGFLAAVSFLRDEHGSERHRQNPGWSRPDKGGGTHCSQRQGHWTSSPLRGPCRNSGSASRSSHASWPRTVAVSALLLPRRADHREQSHGCPSRVGPHLQGRDPALQGLVRRSEEHTSELQSRENLVCRLLLEK